MITIPVISQSGERSSVTLSAPIIAQPPSGWTLGRVPFAPSSSWNTPIASNATLTAIPWPASTGWNYTINWDQYSPAVHFSAPSDPLVTVTFPANWGYPAGNFKIRVRVGVSGAAGTDGEILIIDGDTVYNFWQFKRTGTNTATASACGKTSVNTGSGWGSKSPFLSAGISAVGHSQLAGLLVQAETDAGEILHALALATDGAITQPGFVGEAISGDGYTNNGIVKEGQRLAIPKTTATPAGMSPLGQKVWRALQNYGAFVIDVAGGCSVIRAQQNAYSEGVISSLQTDMGKIVPKLRRVV